MPPITVGDIAFLGLYERKTPLFDYCFIRYGALFLSV